ncbi:MAG TPA: formate dehydrogenase accessory protein FdhE [Longimicrobiales bacterium]|nr:formate dehydrogenase accessory protein FdhE [Longimicrobiales bacterium]
MHGTGAGLRDVAGSLSELEATHPEWRPWLRPLGVALASLDAAPWRGLAPVQGGDRAPADPLLHAATVPVDGRAARGLVRAVLAEALGGDARAGLDALDAAGVLEGAVACDDGRLSALAQGVGADEAAFAAAAQLAALPLLHGCRRALEPGMPRGWSHGYCPICGAWPALVEVLGLERARRLRCGRCGAGWSTEVLLCAFCGERDHGRLGALVPDGRQGQLAWVETCAACGGYLKAVATLRGAAPEALPLEDARSVELDLAALERGFHRPAGPGRSARIRLAPAALVAG